MKKAFRGFFICLFVYLFLIHSGFCSFHMTAGALPLNSWFEKKISGKMTCGRYGVVRHVATAEWTF